MNGMGFQWFFHLKCVVQLHVHGNLKEDKKKREREACFKSKSFYMDKNFLLVILQEVCIYSSIKLKLNIFKEVYLVPPLNRSFDPPLSTTVLSCQNIQGLQQLLPDVGFIPMQNCAVVFSFCSLPDLKFRFTSF